MMPQNLSVTLEGIYFDCHVDCLQTDDIPTGQVRINKCMLSYLNMEAEDLVITCSKIRYICSQLGAVKCYNSYIGGNVTGHNATFTNCIVAAASESSYEGCIVGWQQTYNNDNFAKSPASNCLFVLNGLESIGKPAIHENVVVTDSWEDVFDFEGDEFKWDDSDFVLQNDFVSKYVTLLPIGIYKGDFPFSPTLDLPTIKSLTVANRSTADGKLSINVEIENK